MIRKPTEEEFLNDVRDHQMTVALDSGLHRHIRFRSAGRGYNQWFDLVTWPGFLTICGDMGTWTFARVEDMFTFFRSTSGLKINPSYWSEKLQHGTHGGTDGAKVFDFDTFSSELLNQLEHYYGYEGKRLAELTEAVKEEVLSVEFYPEAVCAARDFRHHFGDKDSFMFDCCELPDGKDYAYHFLWCLYAIVWGIQQFDAAVKAVGVVE